MAIYKTAISFGLVHIPVSLNPIIKNNDISFNYLHKKCLKRINYQKYCPICKKELGKEDLVKGYQYAKDKYIAFDDNDFEKLKSNEDKTIEIISFVNLNEIDPIYYDKSYYLEDINSSKAFSLFKKALKNSKKVAIAKTVMGNKGYYVTLRFGENNIIMNKLFYEEEINIGEVIKEHNFNEKELNMALKLIDSMSGTFNPVNYNDEYQTRVKYAIERKIKGEKVKPIKQRKQKTISDLMNALEESIKSTKKKAV